MCIRDRVSTQSTWDNQLALAVGLKQREQVLPQTADITQNKKKIGFYQPNVLDSRVQYNNWLDKKPDFLTRTAKIYLLDDNHMHNVPVLGLGKKWCVQFERGPVFKNVCNGWTHVTDTMSKRLVKFGSLEDAVAYCRALGAGYEVNYPHFRYHARKSYADNFKWKGPPKKDEDEAAQVEVKTRWFLCTY
eukprot:TRINITY_DN5494_c0_g1_i1.p1 TRINITY_DN5494_c0_g1~~TRINITY_DN5494_c0_g1_i1.p1  ORF type:complete len:211 (-),score=71.66 TRINITY_DN5494_c0_g1_i1:128-694(-)